MPIVKPLGLTQVQPVRGPTWAIGILQKLGAPISQNNIDNLVLWSNAEEPTSQWYRNNWMNTAEPGFGGQPWTLPGSGQCVNFPDCIQNYPNQQDGIDAWTTAISSSQPGVVAALKANASPTSLYNAIQASTYCSSAGCSSSDPGYPGTLRTGQAPLLGPSSAQGSAAASGAAVSSASAATGQVCLGGSGKVLGILPTGVCIQKTTVAKWLGGAEMVAGGVLMLAGVFIIVKGAVPKSVGAVVAAASPQARAARAVTGARRTSARERQSTARATGKAQRKAIPEKMANEQSRDRAATIASDRKAVAAAKKAAPARQKDKAIEWPGGHLSRRPPRTAEQNAHARRIAREYGDTDPF